MANKRITVNNKFKEKLRCAVSNSLCLSDVSELTEDGGKTELFESPPEHWTDFEKAFCDWLGRKNIELTDSLLKLLGEE